MGLGCVGQRKMENGSYRFTTSDEMFIQAPAGENIFLVIADKDWKCITWNWTLLFKNVVMKM